MSSVFSTASMASIFCSQTSRPSSTNTSRPKHMEGESPCNNAGKVSSRSRRESSKPRHHPGRRQPSCDQHVFESIKLRHDFTRPGSRTNDRDQHADPVNTTRTDQDPIRGRAFTRQRFRIRTCMCGHEAIDQTVVTVLQAAHRRQSRIVFN